MSRTVGDFEPVEQIPRLAPAGKQAWRDSRERSEWEYATFASE